MPQYDRYKNRSVNIEFHVREDFSKMPYPGRFSLVFLTDGSVSGLRNDRPFYVSAPGVLCFSDEDELCISENNNVSAQSFCFDSDFLSSIPIPESQDYASKNLKIQTGLSLFSRDSMQAGLPKIPQPAFPQLFEWFFVLGTEVYAQSDGLWACRIKKYLIQILGMLEDLNRLTVQSPVDLVLEYIHTNYTNKISLADQTSCAHLNRVSLNQLFHQRCGCTAMAYLLNHRLKVASNLLTHTDMSLNEIARSTGFEYDTYFIKQFSAKKKMSPTAFRKSSRELAR